MKRLGFGMVAVLLAGGAKAQSSDPIDRENAGSALGADFSYSTDADSTEVLKTGVNFDIRSAGPENYAGIRVERVRFNPAGSGWRNDERVYIRGASSLGDWKWAGQVGTDGDTIIGTASIHDEAVARKELFVERDILETRRGLREGIYYTIAGAAIDLPVGDRNVLNVLGAFQTFTGDNVRTHLRANYVHVLDPELGLSAQLRTRYFSNSKPREFDYYSPLWYAQALPVLQLRRFEGGWMYLFAGGLGVQRDNTSGWRRATYVNVRFTSPPRDRWALTGAFTFSETPTVTGQSYNYMQLNLGVTRRF